jgi:hypothetical protein
MNSVEIYLLLSGGRSAWCNFADLKQRCYLGRRPILTEVSSSLKLFESPTCLYALYKQTHGKDGNKQRFKMLEHAALSKSQ